MTAAEETYLDFYRRRGHEFQLARQADTPTKKQFHWGRAEAFTIAMAQVAAKLSTTNVSDHRVAGVKHASRK